MGNKIVDEIEFIMMKHFANNEKLFEEWLEKKHYQFDDKTPLQLFEQGREQELLDFLKMCKGNE